jgi:hypothetical protein
VAVGEELTASLYVIRRDLGASGNLIRLTAVSAG